jgi:hypothetical protein
MVGVILNFALTRTHTQYTQFSEKLTAIAAFTATGDVLIARGGTIGQWSSIINSGIKVAMMYGDRDFTCNCKLIDFHYKIISSVLMLIDYNRAWWRECQFEY